MTIVMCKTCCRPGVGRWWHTLPILCTFPHMTVYSHGWRNEPLHGCQFESENAMTTTWCHLNRQLQCSRESLRMLIQNKAGNWGKQNASRIFISLSRNKIKHVYGEHLCLWSYHLFLCLSTQKSESFSKVGALTRWSPLLSMVG